MPSKKEQKKEEMSEEKAQPRVVQDRYTKLAEIRALGINPYPYKYEPTAHSEQLIQSHLKLKENERTKELFRVAGRIVSLRKMGKISFGHVQDQKGRIQFLIHQDIDPEQYRLFELLDLGDIVGIEGQIFKTKTGEVTIDVNKLTLLCKTLYPLPEKWHGIQDPELKYRKRYLHLIMSPEVKNVFITREKIINAVRQHLTDKSFIEVDTPILQPIYGGAAAKPFKTHLNSLNMDVYLRISNELYLKRLIVGGFERVFEFSKDFRNEGIDRTHNPEFLSMECYQAYADYNDMMELTEDMISSIAKKINGTTKLDYQGMKIDFKKPWNRLTMADALKKFAKIDVVKMKENELKDLITEHKIEMTIEPTVGHMINELFEKLVADKIVEPTFIMDHPKETTPLCKIHRKNPALVERFEPMVCGMEIGNAYSELNDPVLQKKFLEEQAAQLRLGSAEAHPMDEDFVRAIEYGMPPTGGLGIGIDRIVMLLTNQPSIRDVLLFPFMRLEK